LVDLEDFLVPSAGGASSFFSVFFEAGFLAGSFFSSVSESFLVEAGLPFEAGLVSAFFEAGLSAFLEAGFLD